MLHRKHYPMENIPVTPRRHGRNPHQPKHRRVWYLNPLLRLAPSACGNVLSDDLFRTKRSYIKVNKYVDRKYHQVGNVNGIYWTNIKQISMSFANGKLLNTKTTFWKKENEYSGSVYIRLLDVGHPRSFRRIFLNVGNDKISLCIYPWTYVSTHSQYWWHHATKRVHQC